MDNGGTAASPKWPSVRDTVVVNVFVAAFTDVNGCKPSYGRRVLMSIKFLPSSGMLPRAASKAACDGAVNVVPLSLEYLKNVYELF